MIVRILATHACVLYCALLGAADNCQDSLSHYLACNNPRAIAYLGKLDASQKGQTLPGFTLSDQTVLLRDHLYLGRIEGLPAGVHVHLFRDGSRTLAYAWVDNGAPALELPDCPADESPGSAHVLSGDVYTWAALQPGDGVVQIDCIADAWQ